MSVHLKLLDPAVEGFVVRDSLALEEKEAPDAVDVPVSYGATGPLKRYRFRFRSLQGINYYWPETEEPIIGGEA